jgi:hypothetical protein
MLLALFRPKRVYGWEFAEGLLVVPLLGVQAQSLMILASSTQHPAHTPAPGTSIYTTAHRNQHTFRKFPTYIEPSFHSIFPSPEISPASKSPV